MSSKRNTFYLPLGSVLIIYFVHTTRALKLESSLSFVWRVGSNLRIMEPPHNVAWCVVRLDHLTGLCVLCVCVLCECGEK